MTEFSKHDLALQLATQYSRFPQVEAVAVAGSLTSGTATDQSSDIDLYVYTTGLVPLEDRFILVESAGGASRSDMNLDFWDLGDEWIHSVTGIEVDVMYWGTGWIEEALDRVVVNHQASLGYSTSHWHTIQRSNILFDRNGWFERLKAKYDVAYPEPLRRAIISRNHMILREVIPAYLHQIEKAVKRNDLVSINHRVAALLASYFDIIFAVNRVLNPGEKRLLEHAKRLCSRLPDSMFDHIELVLLSAGRKGEEVLEHLDGLLDQLDAWLRKEEIWLNLERP